MSSTRTPALFIGHGTPMNALANNAYTQAWRNTAAAIPKPKAILAISAHWYTEGTAVTAMERPKTIHDFGGFPAELFAVQYPAPGDSALAKRIRELLAPIDVGLDYSWGLDHGTWSVLVHMYPKADVPVLQLSIDATKPSIFHYELGKKLRPLREQGVLVAGFGNVVHNLRMLQRQASTAPFGWATEFNDQVRDCIVKGEDATLIRYDELGAAAQLSVPTPEHYLPLLYILGLREEAEQASIVCDGIDLGSISMLSVAIA